MRRTLRSPIAVVRLALVELRRFRGPVRPLVLIALVLLPTLYAATYLWANWDPYGNTAKIPVAVVNADRLAHTDDGQRVDAGADVVTQLRAQPLFDWRFVDRAEARHGLEQGDYYFTITIPADFSSRLASAQTTAPTRGKIHIEGNDANNYVAGIMAEATQSELEDQINTAVHTAYVRAIYGELSGVQQQLDTAAEGADQLVAATATGKKAAGAMVSGTRTLAAASGDLATGADEVATAAGTLTDLSHDLASATSGALPAAAASLVSTAQLVDSGVSDVRRGTSAVHGQTGAVVDALHQLAEQEPAIAQSAAFRHAQLVAQAADARTGRLDSRAAQAAAQSAEALSKARGLERRVGALQQDLSRADGATRLISSGAAHISRGVRTVERGTDSLAAAAGTTRAAARQAHEGASAIADTVDSAPAEIPPTDPDHTARAADVLGSPVGISRSNLHPAGAYGRGFAPFFFGIALWVFGLAAYLFLQPLNRRLLARNLSPVTVTAASWLPAIIVGTVGTVVMVTVTQLGLGLDPEHPLLLWGLLLLALGAFVAISQFFRVLLGAPASFALLVLLVLQLTASGGLYPMPTAPGFFQMLNPLLPMTYLVDGLRVAVSGGEASHAARDAVVLAGVMAAFLALTALVLRRRRMWTMATLRPEIEG
jgi:putative membrane protein